MQGKKLNYRIIAIVVALLIVAGYKSYLDVEYAIKHAIYTIAYVQKMRPAKNGWKVNTQIYYKNKMYKYEHLQFWETFSVNQNSRRLFATISVKNKKVGLGFIYDGDDVPDSIQSAPPEGWTEQWMKEHFPKVVENLHDMR